MLIERFAAEFDALFPTCTTLGGVLPLDPSLADTGEFLRIILMPGALLGVSTPARLEFNDLLERENSMRCSCFGGDEGTGLSSRSACVTFENLIAGGGSSSESLLSSMSMRLSIGASAEKPCNPFEMESGEFRRI